MDEQKKGAGLKEKPRLIPADKVKLKSSQYYEFKDKIESSHKSRKFRPTAAHIKRSGPQTLPSGTPALSAAVRRLFNSRP